jgi:hypothetical protein
MILMENRDFPSLHEAYEWYRYLPIWKQIVYNFIFYPCWPFTVKGQHLFRITLPSKAYTKVISLIKENSNVRKH